MQTQVLGLLLSNTVFMVNVCHAFINILIAVDMILVLKKSVLLFISAHFWM